MRKVNVSAFSLSKRTMRKTPGMFMKKGSGSASAGVIVSDDYAEKTTKIKSYPVSYH